MEYLASVIVFAGLALILWALGRKVMGLFRVDSGSIAGNAVFSFGIGFGIISYLVLVLGIFKILYLWAAAGALIAVALCVLPEIKKCLNETRGALSAVRSLKLDNTGKVLLGMTGVALIMTLFGALSPSYSNDSMVYHLKDAKYFAEHHMVGLIPGDSTNSLWPYLVEMYYTLALLFGLFPMAGLVHFSLACAAALGVYAFVKRFFSREMAILASAIFFLTPAIFTEATHTYVDLGSLFYAFLAFYAFVLYTEDRKISRAVLSGMMCGFGMSVKYFFVVVPVILGAMMIFDVFRTRSAASAFKALLVFSASAAVFSGTWYIRQYITRGTPVFPFFANIFGCGGLDPEVIRSLSEESIRSSQRMIVSLKSLLSLPWRMTMSPGEFGGEKLGPVFLAVIPAVVFLRKIDRRLKLVLVFASAYIALWFIQYQHMRFFLTVVPFLSVISAYILFDVAGTKRVLDKIILGAVCVLLGLSVMFSIYRNLEPLRVVSGLESKTDYLKANERAYEVSMYVNKDLSPGARIMVVNEAHTFFIDRASQRELYWWIFDRYDKKYDTPGAVIGLLKSEGFTHILYADPEGAKKGQGTDVRLTELMRSKRFVDEYLIPLYENKPVSRNAGNIKYTVYEIKS
ncbi:MAG: glycosyltransferase family 39 protein [Candidatus Omnitrophota bacterium]